MAKKVAFSSRNVKIEEEGLHHFDLEASLRLYFSEASPLFGERFFGRASAEIAEELQSRLDEIDLSSSLTILSAVEAGFRVDYLQRCYAKRRDPLSRELRDIYKISENRARLSEDILKAWQSHRPAATQLISDLRSAFNFRHWLAHGRYWEPKLGRNFDYLTVFGLAEAAFAVLQD